MALLRIANLKKSYNITKTQKQDVLKGVNAEFKAGEIVALLGESGCGKSTLINILGGLDTDYTGSVVIKGDFIRDFSEKQMDDYRKKRVGLIFQNYNLISHMSIFRNVEIAMTVSNIDKKVREKRTMSLLRLVGLADYAQKLPSQLSGGQKQRVAIARALANNPTVLLADEPTGALDADSAAVIMQILQKIARRGKLVIVVTHSEKVAAECNRVVRLEDGVVVSDEVKGKADPMPARDREIEPGKMSLAETGRLAAGNIVKNIKRNMLVSTGLAIGMTAVLLILCLSAGLTSYVQQVYADDISSLQMTAAHSRNAEFTDKELEEIEGLDGVAQVIRTYTYTSAQYTCGAAAGSLNNLGAFYDDFVPEMLYGECTDGGIAVNEALAAALGDGAPIAAVGQNITVSVGSRSIELRVEGVYAEEFYEDGTLNALVSENSLLALSSQGELPVNTLYITASDVTYLSALVSDLETLGCVVAQRDLSSETVLEYIDLGTSVLTAVGGISMAVSAIMIFIVLYISISERMKEIGILRAIGARKGDIRKMFVLEAGLIGLGGGLLSVAACLLLSVILNIICYYTLGYAMIAYNVLFYLGGLLVSFLVSILAGIAPSVRAAELDPVEALRAE